MPRRDSEAPAGGVGLGEDVVDRSSAVICPGITLSQSESSAIAPWLNELPPQSPKVASGRSLVQSSKSSFSSLCLRQGSVSSFLQRHQGRLSDAHSAYNRSEDDDSSRILESTSSITSSEARFSKSSLGFLSKLKSRTSKSSLGASVDKDEHFSLQQPAPPLPDLTHPLLQIPSSTSGPFGFTTSKKEKQIKKKINAPTSSASSRKGDPPEHQYPIDTNFDNLDGIVDLSISASSLHLGDVSPDGQRGRASIACKRFSEKRNSATHSVHETEFTNPFSSSHVTYKRKSSASAFERHRRCSPKSIYPLTPVTHSDSGPSVTSSSSTQNAGPGSPNWIAPESWAVELHGEDPLDGDYSTSDDSVNGTGSRSKATLEEKAKQSHQNSSAPSPVPQKRRKSIRPPRSISSEPPYRIRIYRANNTYHVVSIPLHVTVASLAPALNKKLLLGADQTQHRLYLKERGKERLLANTERPADIVRRRLEQAGYGPLDAVELTGGATLSFLLRFMYKSQLLGPAEEDHVFEKYDYIDLTGQGLRTIPVALHQNAEQIVSLRLSRNPMLEIPLDFIQSCATLRELRLSNMAMKKVPQSLRHSTTLHRLDLSSNRIGDLDEAYLDNIPELKTLAVQNNRLEKLPWHFPRLRSLITLNLSNNKFRVFPLVICQLEHLHDLDISFNLITELPDEIGQLTKLERLNIVGNQVSKFPDECKNLVSLRVLDCRRNQISDLSLICMLPQINNISAEYNAVYALDLSCSQNIKVLDVCHNDITQLSLVPSLPEKNPNALTFLNLSHAKLSTLDNFAIGQLVALRVLVLDHNSFRYLPDSIGDLVWLEKLSCADNKLGAIPSTIGNLQRLAILDAHNNSLTELPQSLWSCSSLSTINATSNLIKKWHNPPVTVVPDADRGSELNGASFDSKSSTASSISCHTLPPLVNTLQRLFLGENKLTDDILHPLMIFKELLVLNLSFNEIQDFPPNFFRNMTKLQEIYLSGNKLTTIPTEDLPRLQSLTTLFLNGNKLQTLPHELAKVKNLAVLDVGSNLLKYNINNWEFDWNWNFNKNLKYLNLSGNKRLQIKPDAQRHLGGTSRSSKEFHLGRKSLSGFTNLNSLSVLGLMDVTITTTGMGDTVDIPDENEDRRVRTSCSTVNNMSYGIADALGKDGYLNMLDLVHEFPDRSGEAIFAMVGRSQPLKVPLPFGASPNRLANFIRDSFIRVFLEQLKTINRAQGEGIADALRRTFLRLNEKLHDFLFSSPRKMSTTSATGSIGNSYDHITLKSGASGIVVYFKEKTMYIANVGNALAVVSRQGLAELVSRKHDPYDRAETARIRAAEGWISPPGLVNDESDTSRSFGYFHLLPVVNARPDVFELNLCQRDEFVIVANRGLWDYVPYQIAVDIARSVARGDRLDPMIAAQKLRDFAISYGADGCTMIMVICVADLVNNRQPNLDSLDDPQIYHTRKKDDILDRKLARLMGEVDAPVGHVALVFTDIRNSTHLWEANPGMPTAMHLHNDLLRRQLRFCGGYEVKTEGDAFMCSFPTALAAVWWCVTVQILLLQEAWPLEILECEDGKLVYDSNGTVIAGGLSVRMGIHCGLPVCEPDPTTHRMDYFGPIVNRASRISGSAAGGQIMCSADVIRELDAKVFQTGSETEYSKLQPAQAIDSLRRIGVDVVSVGEVKLKGLELPEILSLIYPRELTGRKELKKDLAEPSASGSRVQFSIPQMRHFGMLCLRLEYLASGRIFRALHEGKGSLPTPSSENEAEELPAVSTHVVYGDPHLLLPPMNEQSTDTDLMFVLDSLCVRLENVLTTLANICFPRNCDVDKATLLSRLWQDGGLDEVMLQKISAILEVL